MDIQKIRVKNLAEFIKQNDGAAALEKKYTDVNASYLSQLINNHRPFGEKSARKLESIFDLPPLFFDCEHLQDKKHAPSVNQVRARYDARPLNQVPLISWVQAGMFAECIDDLGECEMIATDLKIKAHTFALRVQGDSMEPILNEGMIVIVEPDMQALHGHYVVAKNGDNEATLKQLVQDGGDWFLKPLNTRYPVKPLGDSHIVGVVRQSITKFA